jgi:hypothetical protein
MRSISIQADLVLEAAHVSQREEGQRCTEEQFPPSVTKTSPHPAWSELPPINRYRLLTNLSRLLQRRFEEPARSREEMVECDSRRCS